jgi:serine/threonine-protein kinase
LEGKKTLAELETVLAAALQSARWSPALVMVVLRDAVAAGRIPPDMLRRLGLEEPGDPTVARPPSEAVDSGAGAPVSRESISTGQVLGGRYRLERKLGEGGMGVVYLASDQEVQGEIFAIKVLTPEIRERPDALELLREEVRKTRTLAHPNIVGVYSLNVDRTGVFILMECLEGKTLQALLDEDFGRGMRFDRAWPIIEDLGAALAYAHDHSVIHGDLKPANVFVITSGRAKLLDFGIARAARGSRWGKDAAALGALTPAYASCEMLEYLPPDTRDDIYALACIIYEMLSGRHPFDRRNALEARDAGEKPTPITALTARQNAALAQGLAFERAARTATVEELLAGLAPGAPAKPRAGFSRATGVAALVVAASVALAYFVADRFWFARHRASDQPTTAATNIVSDKSIAVLPFTDMSEKKDQEYFADGLAEEILSLLATLPGLRVVSRTSSFQFKGQNADLRTVGAQLGAAYVVEGSVRRYGDRVRVTAQLINAHDGVRRWGDSYERDFGDVLRMQQDIAAAIGRALQVEVDSVPWQTATTLTSTEAYTSYLHGLHAMDRYDKTGFEEAVTYFEQALAVDPSLTRARERLGQAHYLQFGFGFVTPTVGADHLRRDVDSILRENPRSAMGHALRAELLITYDWDWAAAEREAELGVSLAKSDSFGLYVAGDVATALGQWEQAETLLRQALAIDPLEAEAHDLFSWTLFHAGRFAEAEVEGRRVLEIRPSYALAHFDLGLYLLAQGEPQAALSEMQQEKIDGVRSAGLAMAFHALRRKVDSDAALHGAERDSAQDTAYWIACAHAFRGDANAAFQWLDRAYTQRDIFLEYIKGEWALKGLESDPRYKAFLRKMNLPE